MGAEQNELAQEFGLVQFRQNRMNLHRNLGCFSSVTCVVSWSHRSQVLMGAHSPLDVTEKG